MAICCENDDEFMTLKYILFFRVFHDVDAHRGTRKVFVMLNSWHDGSKWLVFLDVIIQWVLFCQQGVVWLTFFFWWIVHLLMETFKKIGQLIAWLSSCVWSAGSWSRDSLWLVVSLLKRAPSGSNSSWRVMSGPPCSLVQGARWSVMRGPPCPSGPGLSGQAPSFRSSTAPSGYTQAGGVGQPRQGGSSDSAICVWLLVPILSGCVLTKQN